MNIMNVLKKSRDYEAFWTVLFDLSEKAVILMQ
jgi:hypothetical protein